MRRRFVLPLSSEDVVDLLFEVQEGEVIGFAMNLRCLIYGKWHEVYRVDTCHGYLHEQRFWISPKPIPLLLEEGIPLKQVVNKYLEKVKKDYERYKKYYVESIG